MTEVDLFENVAFLRDLSLREFFLFFVYLFVIFAAKWLLQFILRKVSSSIKYREKLIPTLHLLLNWLAFYGSILLFLVYFSTESWLFAPFYETEEVEVSLFLIMVAIMIVSFANRLVKAFNVYVMPFVYDQFGVEIGMRYTFNRVLYYSVMVIALAVSFTSVGLDLRALGVIFGVLGIGIGFGMRNVAANFVSGIIIVFERPIEVGETVHINGKVGKVKKIRLRSTVVETYREGNLIVPNQHFIEQIIRNQSSAVLLAEVQVGVLYGTDTDQVETLLREAVQQEKQKVNGVLPEPEADIQFVDFEHQEMKFRVRVPVDAMPAKEEMESRTRHAVAELFYKNGIEMASPSVSLENQ